MKLSEKSNERLIEVPKPLAHKVLELLQALQLLRDSAQAVREGKSYHLAVLSGQLRGLLLDKSKRSETRLLQIADAFGVPLKVFHMPSVDDESLPLNDEQLLFHMSGFPMSTNRTLKNQVENNLEDSLKVNVVRFNGKIYSLRTIVEWFANKAGGSHYSKVLPKDFAELLMLNTRTIRPLHSLLVQFAEATVASSVQLLNTVSQFEIHLSLAVPTLPDADACILNAANPDTPMRFSLSLAANGDLILHLVGLDGNEMVLRSKGLMEWNKLHHVSVSINITSELFTSVVLQFDGETVARHLLNAPLFLQNDWTRFDVHYNKSMYGNTQDFAFAKSEVIAFGKELSAIDKANMLIRFSEKLNDPTAKVIFFEQYSFSRSEPGQTKYKMSREVKHCEINAVI